MEKSADEAQAVQAGRNQAVELFRVLAALGIVIFHAKAPGAAVGYAGLVFFLILSPMFEVGSNLQRRRSLKSLAVAFLVPWAFWMLVYGALNVAKGSAPLPTEHGVIGGILGGTTISLWFLPLMFAVLVATCWLKERVPPALLLWVSTLVATMLLLAASQLRVLIETTSPPYQQWIHSAPAIFVGIALGASMHVRNGRWFVVPIAAALAYVAYSGVRGFAIAYPLGVLAIILAAWFGARVTDGKGVIEAMSKLTMGIYLVYVAALMVIGQILGNATLITAIVAFVASMGGVWVARRFVPVSRYIL